MKEFDAKKHFLKFIRNLKTSDEQEEIILKRVAKITKVINLEYWEIHSESKNSTLVGSYGRGTAINLSDVDLLIKLPENQKQRFTTYLNNGQSALLQDIKSKLKEVYPTSQIKGDGQIVSIKFSDGIGGRL
ncbi:SMODS domain-containing nucleotidyltransferase [Latilactobacillus sakei]|uniref:SMODS domain-containing nucleotidyltransferase n=1 Tax=Latilactobacillus sakei TaxID=1599 RepID=UPI0020C76779|nr:nucleotidyltransferase domain-containing protein [Latilactobacillus sakei]MCP8852765.1 nucleotidyltransferase domain-containing protein [Latilactobacillus sakei]